MGFVVLCQDTDVVVLEMALPNMDLAFHHLFEQRWKQAQCSVGSMNNLISGIKRYMTF